MSAESSPPKQRFISLRIKVLIAFTILFTIIFIATYYWFFLFSTTRAENRIRKDLMDTLVAAANGIDGDQIVALYEQGKPREDGFTDDPRYWDNLAWFEIVHDIEPRAWPGTYIVEEGNLYFVTDLYALSDPESAVKFQEWCDPNPDVCGVDVPFNQWTSVIALNSGEPILHPKIISDQWGSWLSGFAPLKNDKGETVAGIFVDFEADYVQEVKDGIRDSVFLAFVITYSFYFIIIYAIATIGTRPILKLTRAAEAVGEGNYDQDFTSLTKSRFPDEISKLARVFTIMVEKVSQREQTLKRRVEELAIEIDQVKRQNEVQKIVESESFRDLQDMAKEMRARRKGHKANDKQPATKDSD